MRTVVPGLPLLSGGKASKCGQLARGMLQQDCGCMNMS
jgi:hypothetical protein